MAIKASSGLRAQMMVGGSFKSIMENDCKLLVYAGTEPSTANSSIGSATLLLEITEDGEGGGLEFASEAPDGVLQKASGQEWSGSVIESGTLTFYRLVLDEDSGGTSSSQPRIQGTVGIAGADLNFSNTDFVESAFIEIENFVVVLPTV